MFIFNFRCSTQTYLFSDFISYGERLVLRKTLPSYNNGTIFVIEKVMDKLESQSTEQKLQEDRFNQRLKKIANENEVLEIQLHNKNRELAKLDHQFRKKQVKFNNSSKEKKFRNICVIITGRILSVET